jgi:hypothetical protein
LVRNRISEEAFLAKFPVNPRLEPSYVTRILEDAFKTKNASDVESAIYLGFRFKTFGADSVDILCKLLTEDWHRHHEDIAWLMQKLKDPRCVEALYQTALARFPYLAYDDAHALAVKSLWALSEINTKEAQDKLELLTKSDVKVIRENAERLLKREP